MISALGRMHSSSINSIDIRRRRVRPFSFKQISRPHLYKVIEIIV